MRKLLGGMLMAIGIVIAGTCGLCTGGVLITSLTGSAGIRSLAATIPFVAIFGGLPTLAGVGMIIAGLRMLRAEPPDYRPGQDTLG